MKIKSEDSSMKAWQNFQELFDMMNREEVRGALNYTMCVLFIENMRLAGKISKEEKRILDNPIEDRIDGEVVQAKEDEVFKNLKQKFY